MSTLETSLLIATALALFIQFLYKLPKAMPRWLDFVPAALLVFMLSLIVFGGFHMYMVVVYIMVIVLFFQTIKRMRHPFTAPNPSRWQLFSSLLGLILGTVGLIVGIIAGPIIASGGGENLSRKSWSTAFEQTNAILAQRYGFGKWKQIDWDALRAEFAPRIAAAEDMNDVEAYYLALQEYFFSIPDGHIKFSDGDMRLWREQVGGGYGLGLIELDDGSAIVHKLSAGGPAEIAGITWGAVILEWDGVPVQDAIGQVAPIWWEVPPATQEGRRYVQQTLLTRAAVGAQVNITFQNHGEAESQTVRLTAVDDGMEPIFGALGWWDEMKMRQALGETLNESAIKNPPTYQILPQGHGYLRVSHVIPDDDDPDFAEITDQAMREFSAQDVPGVIIDVRGNPGGMDTLVPQIMGHFFTEPDFYEYMYFENWLTGIHFFDLAIPVTVEPREPLYDGPVAVLIDQHTRSSGEGFPLLAQRLTQGHIIGVYGTNGSFGMCCASIDLPEGFALQYPGGQSRDDNYKIQLDSNYALQGGVVPDTRVPLNWDTVYAMYVAGEDVVLQYAIEALQAP